MSAPSKVYRFDALAEDYPEAVGSILEARARVEAEVAEQLDEQARIRADAEVRAVAPAELLESRGEDLRRLQQEHVRAENLAIAAIERRMEAELRLIEADNERIQLEVQAGETAQARLLAEQEALEALRAKMDEEMKATVLAHQRGESEQRAQEAAQARRESQAGLIRAFREQEALEQQLTASQRELLKRVEDSVAFMGLQLRLRRSQRLSRGLAALMAGSWVALAAWLDWADPALVASLKTLILSLP